ncbi:MAG: hypothetical protein ACRDEB_04100, partial [Chitinophagaceae bacterium]
MRKLFIILLSVAALISCNQKNKDSNSKKTGNKNQNAAYTMTKDGIGELKIGMTQAELEKLLGQKLMLKHANDTGDIWSDTATAKYNEMDVTFYFERQYNEDKDIKIMELYGIETSNPLCKTETGIGIGDNRATVLSAYEENPINMGPEYEQVNDTT